MRDAAGFVRNVRNVNARRPASMSDGGRHKTLHAAAENENRLADEVRAFNGVHGVSQRIENRGVVGGN